MKKLLVKLALLQLLSTSTLFAQNVSLSNFYPHEAGTGYRILDMEYMSNGNLVAVGKFTTWSPEYQAGILNAADGASGGFLVVYNSSGSVVWSHVVDGTGEDAVTGVDIDANNNIYVTGFIESTTPVSMGTGLNLQPATGNFNDGFIVQYTPSGTVNFSVLFGGNGRDKPNTITVAGNELYVGGMFNNTTDLDPSSSTANFTSSGSPGNMDYFIGKYSASNGAYLNGYTNGEDNGTLAGSEETVFGIQVDGSNVYALTRHFLSTAGSTSFGNSVTIGTSTSIHVLLKLNNSLVPVAASDFNTNQGDYKFLEFHNGKCVVVGKNYDNNRLLVTEVNPNLTINNSIQSSVIAFSYVIDPTGFSSDGNNLYVSGIAASSINLNGSSMPVTVTNEPQVAFLAKINHGPSQFEYQWVEQIGHSSGTIYTNGQASANSKVSIGGIVNSTQVNFDLNSSTLIAGENSHGSAVNSYAPFFAEYATCVPPTSTSTYDQSVACNGGEITLTATGASPIDWYLAPTGGSVFLTGNEITMSVFGSGNLYMQNACSSTRVAVPFYQVTPQTPIINGPNSHCAGSNTSLSAINVDSYLDVYSWTGGGTDGTTTISATATGTSDYTVSFTASNEEKNCTITVTGNFDVIQAQPFEIGQSTICLTDENQISTFQFAVDSDLTSPQYTTFTWSGPAVVTPENGSSFSLIGSVNSIDYVVCTALNPTDGCQATDTMEVYFNELPTNSIVLSCSEASLGQALLANETSSWSDNVETSATGNSVTLDPGATWIELQVSNEFCAFTTSVEYHLPSEDELVNVNDGSVLEVFVPNSNFTYQWINCDTEAPISGETNLIFSPSSPGNYGFVIDNGVGCEQVSNCIGYLIGLDEMNTDDIQMYPNPAQTSVQISVSTLSEIIFYDVHGKRIQNMPNYLGEQIDISHLEIGVYFIEVQQQNRSYRTKLVIE